MRTVTVKIFQGNEKIAEEKINVQEGETLVIQCPEGASPMDMNRIHNNITEALQYGYTTLTIPYGVKLQTLSTQ